MEEKNTSIFSNGLIWGVIVGLLGVIYSVILYVTDQFLNQALGIIGLVILIGGLAYSTYYFREQVRGGILPFGQAFTFGIVVAVTSALIGASKVSQIEDCAGALVKGTLSTEELEAIETILT